MWKIYIQKKVQEYININPLTCLSYLSLPHSSPPFSYLYHTFFRLLSPSYFILHIHIHYFHFSLSPLPPPLCSPSRVRPTRTGTPQRTTRSLWRTWTSWVDRRSCRRRRSWPWRWPNPWPRCRLRWRNRIVKSHQWPTWSVPEICSWFYLWLHKQIENTWWCFFTYITVMLF